MDMIAYLLTIIQDQYKTICRLLNLLCRYVPLKQWAFDDSHSPKYLKFTTDRLPVIKPFIQQDWQFLLEYYLWKYGKPTKAVQRHTTSNIPTDTVCPLCGAPHHYLYDNNGGNGQYQCKVCGQTFVTGEVVTSQLRFICPYCGHSPVPKKTVNSSAFINASTLNVPFICAISPRCIRSISMRTSGKINTSFTISTANLRWISFAWI